MGNSLDPILAEAFVHTVRGWAFPFSVEISNDEIFLNFENPVQNNAKPRKELIDQLLRSNVPLTSSLREAIASALNPKKGRPKGSGMDICRMMEIGAYIADLRAANINYESVLADAADHFSIARSAAREAYHNYQTVREIEAETYRPRPLQESPKDSLDRNFNDIDR